MRVRSLDQEDRNRIRRLVRQRGTFTAQEIKVAMELVDDALHHGESSDYRILCAVEGTRVLAGYICFGLIPMTDRCYDLYWIVVDKKHAGQGVGANLLEEMERRVGAKKGRHIYVETSSTPAYEAARAFYAKHGYRPVSQLNDFYRHGDHKMIFKKEVCGHVRGKVKTAGAGENPRRNR
jgi:ribosomal protein S18 acetylase RimI-like enzyme